MRKRTIGIALALLAVSAILLFAWGDRVNLPDEDPKEAYYHSIKDKYGFCIEDGILYAYLGKDREITIPKTVSEIYSSALSGDFKHGENLKQVIVPGTVKKIDNGAFAFTSAKKIIVEEGVAEIEEWAFGDSYIEEIWFPSSLEKIGNGIMETEEGLNGTKIHVPKNSKVSQYFEENMPYGNAELIYESEHNPIGIIDTLGDDKVLLHAIDLLSKINSYELTTSRVEATTFGDKQVSSQIITKQKIIFEPFVNWSRTDSTSTRIVDGSQYRSLTEVYQVLKQDQIDLYIRQSPYEDSTLDKEPVVGEWKKISTSTKEQADWTIAATRSNYDAQLYLLSANVDTFKIVEDKEVKDKNILKYEGYLKPATILKAYQKYIRDIYVKGNLLTDSKNISLEDLKNEITGGDLLEIKAGIPKLAYSEKPVPISLWIDKRTFELKKVTVDETLVMQSYMEKEVPKSNSGLKDPVVSKALLTYDIKSIDILKEIPMPD